VREKRLVGEAKSTAIACKGRILGLQKGKIDCKGVERLENILDVQERVKKAFGLELHQEFVV